MSVFLLFYSISQNELSLSRTVPISTLSLFIPGWLENGAVNLSCKSSSTLSGVLSSSFICNSGLFNFATWITLMKSHEENFSVGTQPKLAPPLGYLVCTGMDKPVDQDSGTNIFCVRVFFCFKYIVALRMNYGGVTHIDSVPELLVLNLTTCCTTHTGQGDLMYKSGYLIRSLFRTCRFVEAK